MFLRFKFFLLLCFCVSFLQTASAQTPTAKSFFDRGLIFVSEQKFNEALEAFRQSAKLDPKQAAAHANIGSTLIAMNRAAEAVEPFREAVKLSPNDGMFRANLCRALSMTKNHAEAVAQCTEGVRLSGDKIETHLYLLNASQIANRSPQEVLALIEAALQKFPDNENLLNIAAKLYFDTGNVSQAAVLYEKLTQTNANSAVYQLRLADLYLRLERDAEALAAARKASALEPKNPLAYFYSGKIYYELGQNEEAAEAFGKAVELNETDFEALYLLGFSKERLGKPDEAIAVLRRAVAINPKNYELHRKLGTLLTSTARYEDAVDPLKKAVELKPSDFDSKVSLGLALFESARLEEALPILMEADRMKPGNEVVNMFLGVTRSRQQGMAQIEQMKDYAKENPQNINVRVRLVEMLGFGRKIEAAAPYVEEIWRLKPSDPQIYALVANVYSTAGDYAKASEIHRKTLEIAPNYPGTYLGLATISAKSGQIEEAFKNYEKVLELKPDVPNIMIAYANLLRDNGKRREALAMYKRSLAMLPTNAVAIYNAGILSAKLGDKNAAQQYLTMLKTVDAQMAKSLSRFLKFLG